MALTPLMAGRLDEGLRGELRGGIKAGSEDLAWHLEVVARGDEEKRQQSAGMGEGMELTDGPHMVMT
jgi:hypothetical protein